MTTKLARYLEDDHREYLDEGAKSFCEVEVVGKRLTSLHGLRATGATLGAAESSVRLAQQQAGHSDIRVTETPYVGDSEVNELHQRASFSAVFDMPFEAPRDRPSVTRDVSSAPS